MTYQKQIFFFPACLIFYELSIYLSNDMYLPSLPRIATDLQAQQDYVQYTLASWMLGASSLQFILGGITDTYGRKRLILCGAILFILSSLLCATAQQINTLIFARFLQGSAVCSAIVSGYAMIHDIYDTKQAIKITTIMGALTILAPAFGPMVGAILLEYSDWRQIFLLSAIMGIISFVGLLVIMPGDPHTKPPLSGGRILQDYRLILTKPSFLKYCLAHCLVFAVFIIWIVESPFIIIDTYQKSPLYFGILQMIICSGFFIGAQLLKWLLDASVSVTYIIKMGLWLSVLSILCLYAASFYEIYLPFMIFLMTLFSIGASLCFGPLNRIAIETISVPMVTRVAIFSAMLNLFGSMASTLVTFINTKDFLPVACISLICTLLALISYYKLPDNEKR